MQTDPIADFMTQIRNAVRVDKRDMVAPYSKLRESIAEVLQREGYIKGYEMVRGERNRDTLRIEFKGGRAKALTGVRRVSKPGRRRYVGARDIPRVLGGLGIALMSTSQGVMTDGDARKRNLGGELLGFVW